MSEDKDSGLSQLRDVLIDRGEFSAPPPPPRPPSAPRLGSLPPPAPLDPADPLLARVSPLLELLYLIRAGSGEVGHEEEAVLRGVARTLNGDLRDGQISLLLERFGERLRREGLDERVNSVTLELSADKVTAESAYTLAATLAWADGEVSPSELEILAAVASNLGLSSKRARELGELRSLA